MNQDGLNLVGFLVVQNRIGVSNINPAFSFYPYTQWNIPVKAIL